ncbi:hypothetical protein BJ085DRAFT_29200 [Dimargaris cristalligena]|uniref:Galactose oxidase n=1 Tax=Dimargaris cristalligena TaxID=215637 RepID=A0A4Q0A0Q2_9FUNG|nr:hypothetical protein BJ085DRAFT_29200 [Dimargaris cristalligena]|eukprot:RKP39011.1 hypothetical protein BJ085DRAFT_29200 [Dimargaris cristalligena]
MRWNGLLFALGSIACTAAVSVPARQGHRTALIDNKLFVVAGKSGTGFGPSDYHNSSLTLDLSEPFAVADPPWKTDDIVTEGMPRVGGHSATAIRTSPNNQDAILVFGGSRPKGQQASSNSTYLYSLADRKWTALHDVNTPPGRYEHTAVGLPNRNEVYFYGGVSDSVTGALNTTQRDDFLRFTASNQGWSQFIRTNKSTNWPRDRMHHASVMVNDTHMAVIGGLSGAEVVNVSQIYVVNVKTQTWSTVVVEGTAPVNLRAASAVMFQDQIILFGGTTRDWDTYFDQVLIIDTTVQPWQWSSRVVAGAPSPRYAHTSTLVGKYMVIAFGYTAQGADDQLYVLDVQSFEMVDQFDLREAQNIIPSARDGGDAKLPVGAIVGIALGGAAGLAALAVGLWFLARWWQRRRRNREPRLSLDGELIPPLVSESEKGSNGSASQTLRRWFPFLGPGSQKSTDASYLNPHPHQRLSSTPSGPALSSTSSANIPIVIVGPGRNTLD